MIVSEPRINMTDRQFVEMQLFADLQNLDMVLTDHGWVLVRNG